MRERALAAERPAPHPAPDAARVPLSLYLHFPWCVRKCPYCDFNSHAARGDIPETAYVDALIRDLDWELAGSAERRPLVSVFLGGGTPSLFSGHAIARMLEAAAARLSFAPDIEITLEANPGTADEGHFAAYRAAGINRLSIGVQSLNDTHLKRLGRIHGPDEARHAVAMARRAGFDNLNLDVMFALPEQTLAEAATDLRAALALEPEHLSYYHLTLEPNTEFHARPPRLPDADAAWDMQEQGLALLADGGYAQYEVSAHARAGRQCRHNRNYWEFGDYLGIGAGAHAKRTGTGGIVRRARQKQPRVYLDTAGSANSLMEDRPIPAPDLPFEFAMNALRLNEGFALADFESRTGLAAAAISRPVERAVREGLAVREGDRVVPTARGRAFLNRLTALFLPGA